MMTTIEIIEKLQIEREIHKTHIKICNKLIIKYQKELTENKKKYNIEKTN